MEHELKKWMNFLCSTDRFHNLCISYPITISSRYYDVVNTYMFSQIINSLCSVFSTSSQGFIHADIFHWIGNNSSLQTKDLEQIEEFVVSKAIYLPSKIIFINGPQHFSATVANKILKLLEDPPIPLSFILLGFSYNHLLPTVKSRFLNWRMNSHLFKAKEFLPMTITSEEHRTSWQTPFKTSDELEQWAEDHDCSQEDCLDLLWVMFLTSCNNAQKVDRLLSFQQWFEKSKLWNNPPSERWYFLFQMIKNSLHYPSTLNT